jgi:hypothetical protein
MSAMGNVISKTNDVFLYTMAPTGDRVQLKGQSGTVDSMAYFLTSLKHSGFFDDVQLEQFYQDDQHERLAYKFTLSCLFKSPSGGTSGTGQGPGGPGMEPSRGPRGLTGAPAQVQQSLKRGM